MVKYVVFAVVALVALQGALARPKVKAQAAAPEKGQLEELAANAQNLINNVTETLGLKDLDAEKVVETIHTQAKTLANQVDKAVEKLKTDIKTQEPEVQKALKTIQENLNKVNTNIEKAVGPEAAAKGKEIKASFEKGLKDVVAEVEKLYKSIEPQATEVRNDINKAAKNILDEIIETSKKVQEEVKASIEKSKN